MKRWEWATAAAIKFYSTSFNSTEADLSCIKRAVTCNPSIMIVGRPLGEGEDPFKTMIQCPDSVVILCITYPNGIGDETGLLLVLLLLIAESKAQKPSFVTSWRWQWFGQVMLSMLIKQSTSLLLSHYVLSHCQDRLPGVDIYLQCPHKDPMAFYSACGFLQVNLQDTTGIELLPKTIAETLCNKNAEGFAWIVLELEEHCIVPLMQLCSGSLLNTPKEVLQDKNKGGSCGEGWWFWLPSEHNQGCCGHPE